jgi:AcrR family transcriptional regulator
VRRQQYVDEAIHIIGQQGYNGFTIHELATRCGTSNAGLLYYFGSKDQLLTALLEELEQRDLEFLSPLIEAADREPTPTASAKTAVIELFGAFVLQYTQRVELGRLTAMLIGEAMNPAHPAHEWVLGRQRMALSLFTRLLAPWTCEPHVTARRLLATINGLAAQWLLSGGEFDLVEDWALAVRDCLDDRVLT